MKPPKEPDGMVTLQVRVHPNLLKAVKYIALDLGANQSTTVEGLLTEGIAAYHQKHGDPRTGLAS